MKTLITVFLFCAFFCLSSAYAFADVKLPEPLKEGGTGIFRLLESRASATRGAFPNGAIGERELSTILWAATGLNREGKGWTVPMANGKEPYVKIYVLSPKGAFLYDWKKHTLSELSKENVTSDISSDGFVNSAPYTLVFVADGEKIASFGNLERGRSFGYVAAGAMTQNTYLAADALGIATRYLATLDAAGAERELKLKKGDIPICIMPFAKK